MVNQCEEWKKKKQQCKPRLYLAVKEEHFHMHNVKRTQGVGTEQPCSPKKATWLIRKEGLSLLGSIKIGLWSNGRRSCGVMSPDCTLFQSDECIRVRREEDEVMHLQYFLSMVLVYFSKRSEYMSAWLLGQCYDLGLIELVRSRFSSLMAREYCKRWQCRDSSGSNCERVVQGAWGQTWTQLRTCGMCGWRLYALLHFG